MSDRNRDDDGQFSPERADDAFLSVVRSDGPIGTSAVAELLDVPERTARYRLNKLHDDGKINRYETGNSYLWDK